MIPIIVFYDEQVCSAEDIIADYMKDIPKDLQTIKYYGKPIIHEQNNQIKFNDSVINFIPIAKAFHGMRIKVCFVPEHYRNRPWTNEVIKPMLTSPLIGYYNQYNIKNN